MVLGQIVLKKKQQAASLHVLHSDPNTSANSENSFFVEFCRTYFPPGD